MLTTITVNRQPEQDVITLELLDGRKIISHLDDQDVISIVENTTGIENSVAECAAGICLLNFQTGNDIVNWRQLVEKASECRQKIDEYQKNLN